MPFDKEKGPGHHIATTNKNKMILSSLFWPGGSNLFSFHNYGHRKVSKLLAFRANNF